jgi:hypothetical protein
MTEVFANGGAWEYRQSDLERLERLRPIDDDFMRVIYRDNAPLAEETLRIVTGIEGLQVVSIETQRDLKRLVGARSVELDVMAIDSAGRWHDIEVQRGGSARPKRARYHSAAMDVEALGAAQKPEGLPEQWVIFIMERDPFGEGKGLYHFERTDQTSHRSLEDGTHVLYANGAYRGDDELGELMHDYCESNPDDMRNPLMAERVRYFKRTPKGVTHMCEIFDEIRQEGEKRGFERGKKHGIEQGIEQGEERALLASARRVMEQLSFSAQQALDFLGVGEPQRSRLLAIL